MNIIILKNNIKEALNIISGARKDNSNIPILKSFLIETENGKLKFLFTDLEIGIIYKTNAKVIEKGSVAIPFVMFSQIVNNLFFERINIELKDSTLNLKTDNYNAKISISNKEDFPIIPKIDKKKEISFIIKKDEILESFSSVIESCQISDIKPELSGILFLYESDVLKLVTTDSFRLSEKTVNSREIKTDYNDVFSSIIPLRTIQEVIRIFQLSDDDEIKISFDSNQVAFETENTYLISRVIDGKFPNYKDIIPTSFITETVIEKDDLITALKLSSSLSNKLNEVKFINEKVNKNIIKVYSYNQEVGESEYILNVKLKGDIIKITFNWKFVLDGVKPIKTNDIFIGFNGEDKPSLIRSIQDNSYLYVLMPIKSV